MYIYGIFESFRHVQCPKILICNGTAVCLHHAVGREIREFAACRAKRFVSVVTDPNLHFRSLSLGKRGVSQSESAT